jgi:hypothetical protein
MQSAFSFMQFSALKSKFLQEKVMGQSDHISVRFNSLKFSPAIIKTPSAHINSSYLCKLLQVVNNIGNFFGGV